MKEDFHRTNISTGSSCCLRRGNVTPFLPTPWRRCRAAAPGGWRGREGPAVASTDAMGPTAVALAAVLWCAGGAAGAARPGREPPPLLLPGQGLVVGREVHVSRSQRATLYAGLPFAQPPLGELRFAAPRTAPLPSWTDTRNASTFAPPCPQDATQDKVAKRFLQDAPKPSEDCLYLNVFVPDGSVPSDGWPVVVWLHPGLFTNGNTAFWDGSVLAVKQKILIVTVAYRLGVLGFLTTLDPVSTGNYGLLDQVAALQWVKTRIAIFGGSAKNMTVFGHEAGGVSVGLHLLSPLSAGLFSKAIAMSGNCLVPWAIRPHESEMSRLAMVSEKFSCPLEPHQALVDCLRKVDALQLAMGAAQLGPWGPTVDGGIANSTAVFLPADPLSLLMEGKFQKVPVMLGYTNMEDAFVFAEVLENPEQGVHRDEFETLLLDQIILELPDTNDSCPVNYQHLLDAVLFYYSPQPQAADPNFLRQKLMDFATEKKYAAGAYQLATYTSADSPTYFYRFDYKLKTSLVEMADWIEVPNFFELPLVWGMPYWPTLPLQVIWNTADRRVTDMTMTMWGNFIKFANPAQNGIHLKWDQFTKDSPGILIIDRNFNMSDLTNFDYKAFSFWNDYYPKVVDGAVFCCNVTSGGAVSTATSAVLIFTFITAGIALMS
ncbi:fatty acyl-CoA hydrolase precursor, medium chain [Ischnura elegans]|uniref:fatty acyl-CoA hydrolase precursor, medium chain n=1 Tax=Ischnura elegans TaxID=197161 RepID=UPI001ED87900|nr:fatty acyl-CoA hydrolase precursor, medium chain [Ischnura elegans]